MQRIFVGDVQACAAELGEIVTRASATFGSEYELWLVGDVINRGPESRRSLELVRTLWEQGRARVVLGNHELSLLRLDLGLRELAPDDTFQDILAAPDGREWTEWIRQWPVALRGALGGREFAMVHASSDPNWDLETLERRARALESRLAASRDSAELLLREGRDQPDGADLERVTRCRSAGADGSWSSRVPDTPEGAWHAAWSARGHGFGIVYGHWALQGLHVAPGLRGLDTGCVYHGNGRDGRLTAWVPEPDAADPFAVPDENFWEIPARDRYWRPPG